MQNYLLFLDLKVDDDIKQFFDEKFGEEYYVIYDESSKTGKEHVHVCLDSDYKRDTIQKWIIKTFPQLKRTGHGGEHKYGLKHYPQQYKSNANYDEYPQDYITKDNNYRCGKLWDNVNSNFHSKSTDKPLDPLSSLLEKEQRYNRYNKFCNENKNKTKHSKEPKTSLDVKFQQHMTELIKKTPYYFYKVFKDPDDTRKQLNQRLLIKEIKKFYIDNGKPGNRNIFKVIAEQVIWYGEIVAPEDPETSEDTSKAIENEIESILYKKY